MVDALFEQLRASLKRAYGSGGGGGHDIVNTDSREQVMPDDPVDSGIAPVPQTGTYPSNRDYDTPDNLILDINHKMPSHEADTGKNLKELTNEPMEAPLSFGELWDQSYSSPNQFDDGGGTEIHLGQVDEVPVSEILQHFHRHNPEKATGFDQPWSKLPSFRWEGPVPFDVRDPRLEDGGDTGNMRNAQERAVIEQYAAQIQAGSMPPPILVVETDQGELGVSDGAHRLEAARLAGLDTIPAYIGRRRARIAAERMRGYKVMPLSEDGRQLLSGANGRLTFPAQPGPMRMPGNGIYMSLDRNYVLTYYSGLADNEALVTFDFDPATLTVGNLTDRETEFAVPEANIISIEPLGQHEARLAAAPEMIINRARAPLSPDAVSNWTYYVTDYAGNRLTPNFDDLRALRMAAAKLAQPGQVMVENWLPNRRWQLGQTGFWTLVPPRRSQRQPWVAVDLDGTILESPPKGVRPDDPEVQIPMGAPLPGAADALRELAKLGWRISIYTARFGDEELPDETVLLWAEQIAKHLTSHGIVFSDIWVGRKPRADFFVDDKAIHFDGDWPVVLEQLTLVDSPPRTNGKDGGGTGPFDYAEDANDFSDPLGDRGSRGISRPPELEEAMFG